MNTLKSTKTTKKRNLRRRVLTKKTQKRRRIRRVGPIRGKRLAVASAKQFKKKFRVLKQNGSSVRVTGRDLIYSIPDDNTAPIQSSNVIAVIPANPVYWRGSRIAALASGYQNYRPLRFRITYVPIVAATQQGNVIGGTVWDNGFESDNIQQSLRTSNGGFLTQCYIPHSTIIRPKTNLQFNLYRVGGAFDQQSNPFIFVAIALGCKNSSNQRVIPGYFYVTWSFELKNPIGTHGMFKNTGLTTYDKIEPALNTTIVNVDPASDVPFGAYIDVEFENTTLVPKYNNTPIELETTTPVWAFQSVGSTDQLRAFNKTIIYYDSLTTNHVVQIPTDNLAAIIYSDNPEYYTIRVPTLDTAKGKYANLSSQVDIYYLGSVQQTFGIYQSTTNAYYWNTPEGGSGTNINTLIYHAPKTQFDIQLTPANSIKTKNVKILNVRIKPRNKVSQIIEQLEEEKKEQEQIQDIQHKLNNIELKNEILIDNEYENEEEEDIHKLDAKSQNILRNKNLRLKTAKQLPIP
jgi:hypothetical protein